MNATDLLIARLDEIAELEPEGPRRNVERNTNLLLNALQPQNGATVLTARASDLCRIDHDRVERRREELGIVAVKCVWMRRSRTGDMVHPRIAQVRRSYSEPWPDPVSTVIAFVPHLLEPSVARTLLMEAAELFPGAYLRCVAHAVDNGVAEILSREVQSAFGRKPDIRGARHFDPGGRRGPELRTLLWERGDLAPDPPSQIPPLVSFAMRRELDNRNEPPPPAQNPLPRRVM